MMKIDKPWSFTDDQSITIGERVYNVHASILMAEKLQVKKLAMIHHFHPIQNAIENT